MATNTVTPARKTSTGPELSGEQMLALAWQFYHAGQKNNVEQVCQGLLEKVPLHAEGLHLLGIVNLEKGQKSLAIRCLHQASVLDPEKSLTHHALGEAFRQWPDLERARASYLRAIELEPRLHQAHHSLGLVYVDQEKYQEAADCFRRTIELSPTYERAHVNLGRALKELEDSKAAMASFREALRLKEDYAIAHNNLGLLLLGEHEIEEAERHLRRALQLQPDYPEARMNLGNVYQAKGDFEAARASFEEALRLRPNYAKAYFNVGMLHAEQGRPDKAFECYQKSLQIDPKFADSWVQLGNLLHLQSNYEAAGQAYEKALERKPDHAEAQVFSRRIREMLCDWRQRDSDLQVLDSLTDAKFAKNEPTPVVPFHALSLPWSPDRQLQTARLYGVSINKRLASNRERLKFEHPRRREGRLKIGYLSADFHDHATSHLIQSLFALHDRAEFEIFAYSHGPDDGSHYRRRIQKDVDHFFDCAHVSRDDAARRIHADGIHILVDLKGHTANTRHEILALRPAPIQVHYLGYPGTIGADWVDYQVTDAVVTPPADARHFVEKLVLMPHSYQVNDHRQEISQLPISRQGQMLPEKGFIFCSFNQSYKIEPGIFDVWMRILQKVPDSFLWLYLSSESVEKNLRREAQARGVEPRRLLFGRHKPKPEHLARLGLADLFLDTRYYNAHTTASDALWAGVPVLTCPGETFASRVGSSLLRAVGLPEMICRSIEDYEARAVHLGQNPAELKAIRQKLAANRTTQPLFDTKRFARGLEKAFQEMWDIYAAGGPPRLIQVRE